MTSSAFMSASPSLEDPSNANWTSLLWNVPTRIHNETGFWGPVDAIHQFCEPHYQTSPYICEFYNTLSSFIFVALAVYAWKYYPQLARQDVYVHMALIWLTMICVGSALFHSTMRYSFQLLDEFPMVGFMATLLCGKIALLKQQHWWIGVVGQVVVVMACIGLLHIYVVEGEYEIFIHGFTLLVVVDVIVCLLQTFHPRYRHVQWNSLFTGLATILLGRLAWETENRLCHVVPSVWPLHSVWHVFGCWSAWTSLVFTFIARLPPTTRIDEDWLPGLWLGKKAVSSYSSKRD